MPQFNKNILLYVAKCITGYLLVELLSLIFHYSDIGWCLISVLLVLSPDNTEAIPLALTRIKANSVAGTAGILCLLISAPNIFIISLALAITIVLCYVLKLMAGCRTALVAVIIVMMHGEGKHLWDTALERVAAVIAGCLIGLLITYIYHRKLIKQEVIIKNEEG